MKKIVLIICITVLGLVQLANGADYRYVEAAELKGWLEVGKPLLLVDIQVADEFAAHHLKDSLETNAYPVKGDSDQQRLESALALTKVNNYEAVVVVCPRGKGGAKRAYDYLGKKGVSADKLFILIGGMGKWPYPEWVVSK